MWSQRDPNLRKSGVGNVFVKNLAGSVDNKGLYDTFSVFGNILSCKVVMNPDGTSKGYGYVHYETAEAGEEAIQKFNGQTLDDSLVTVSKFVARINRQDVVQWTNLYVKQFPLDWEEAQLQALFAPFGNIASTCIMRKDGLSKGFGFVNFTSHAAATVALGELNNKKIEGRTPDETALILYVNQAEKRDTRNQKFKNNNIGVSVKYQGLNLYIKNLDDTITEDILKQHFCVHGTITSARIMRHDDLTSKGFGFVCYDSAEPANRAINEFNGKVFGSKPIVVVLHQNKEVRRQYLASTRNARSYAQGPNNMYMQQGNMNNMYAHGGHQGGFPRRNEQQYGGFPAQYSPRGPSPRGMPPQQQQFAPGGRGPYYPMPAYMNQGQQQGYQMQQPQRMPRGSPMNMPQGGRGGGMVGGRGPNPNNMGQQMNRNNVRPPMGATGPMPNQPRGPAVKYSNQARNQPGPQTMYPAMGQQNAAPQSMPVPGLGEPLDDQMLAQADPQQQKNMIGERLFPLIYHHQPSLAGKITGMLLEMDNAELLNLIESPDALASKIEEALTVLKQHGIME